MSGFFASKPFRGALVKKAADQTGANYTGSQIAVAWDAEVYDTSGIHDNVTNNTRLTVPAGVSRVQLGFGVAVNNQTGNTWNIMSISKGGLFTYDGFSEFRTQVNNTAPSGVLWTPELSVAEAEYFEATFRTQSDTAIDILATGSWFAMRIIE